MLFLVKNTGAESCWQVGYFVSFVYERVNISCKPYYWYVYPRKRSIYSRRRLPHKCITHQCHVFPKKYRALGCRSLSFTFLSRHMRIRTQIIRGRGITAWFFYPNFPVFLKYLIPTPVYYGYNQYWVFVPVSHLDDTKKIRMAPILLKCCPHFTQMWKCVWVWGAAACVS